MSTTVAAARAAIKAAVAAASGLDANAVVWSQNGVPHADPVIVLTVTSDLPEVPVRETLSADGDNYAKSVSQMRRWVVQVRCEALRVDALELLNRTQLRMHFEVPTALLSAACVHVDDGPVVDHRYRAHDLWIQARSYDLFLRVVLEESDPALIGTIGTVQVQGDPVVLPPEVSLPEDEISDEESED